MEIKKAIKSQQKLRLGISGASGSGKTYSALLLASSLGSKVCVIDTEQGSASLYADKFEFDVLELTAPYSSERYVEALKRVEMAGYDVIVIDSLSHNWNQSGGCLDKVNQIGGNSYAAWGKVTPQYDKLIHSILACKAHVVTTMRSKTAYELVENDKGKLAPVKRGLAPIQRDGIEYEFTLMFDLDQNHNFICTKDRTGLFSNIDIPEPLNQEVASKLLTWLNSGEAKLNHVDKHFELDLKGLKEIIDSALDKNNLFNMKKELVSGLKSLSSADQETLNDYFVYKMGKLPIGDLIGTFEVMQTADLLGNIMESWDWKREEPSEVFTALKKKMETEAFTLFSLDVFAQEIAANKDLLSSNELAELRAIFKETKTRLNKIEQGEITL
jgi:hypothetical protein